MVIMASSTVLLFVRQNTLVVKIPNGLLYTFTSSLAHSGPIRICTRSRTNYCSLFLAKGGPHALDSRDRTEKYAVLPLKLKPYSTHVRFESTAPNPGKTPDGEQSTYQKFKKILSDFYLGGKELYRDVRQTLKIRKKLRLNDWNYDVLTRRELWKMVKTQKNLKKTLPIVFLSCLPVVGYLGPVIGFLKPRQFLSDHFWTANQKKKFPALDDKERSVYRDVILKDISNQIRDHKEAEYDVLHKVSDKVNSEYDPSNDSLLKMFPIFSTGIFELDNLPRQHLKDLCLFWLLTSWFPTAFLKKDLKNEMIYIHKDDVAIYKEGVQSLTEEELEEACHIRGLNTTNVTSKELSKWLQNWVLVSQSISENETSFLAHQAVFRTVSFGDLISKTNSSSKQT